MRDTVNAGNAQERLKALGEGDHRSTGAKSVREFHRSNRAEKVTEKEEKMPCSGRS